MATFNLTDGVDETEPTTISNSAFQDCTGTEYRVGKMGPHVARGRQQIGDLGAVTGVALYEAGFDGSPGYLLAQQGNSLHAALIASSLAFTHIGDLASGSSAVVGTHYNSRHYLASGVANKRLELGSGGLTTFPIGMSQSTFSVTGISVTGASGSMSATFGLNYWVTEYDSVRGIESITGNSRTSSTMSLAASVVVTLTGTSANRNADTIRWYRSVDGGGWPDGGLIAETTIGTTQIVDTLSDTGTLTVPLYGIVSIGGLDRERDMAPPVFSTIFGPFSDSLLAVSTTDPRSLWFTPAGYPDSWPDNYLIPLETERRDEIVAGVILPGRAGVFCKDSVHVIYRLPRDSDSIFAAGEMQEPVTLERGCMSRRGATAFTPPGSAALAAWVARDGIWASTLTSSPIPLTDKIDWEGRVDVANLRDCRLKDDPENRRLVFVHRKTTDTAHSTGIWYLDYQNFSQSGIRITFADHGPLADVTTIAAADGHRRVGSIDSRASNGQVYLESTQDVDDSHLVDSSGSVLFRLRTKEYLPAGPAAVASMGTATWMHDAGPPRIEHRFYFDRRDSNPEVKNLTDTTKRAASDVQLSRQVNSLSLEIESCGTTSYGVHWVDIQGLDPADLGGREGA